MSSRDWAFRIQDILRAIDKIESFIKGMTLSKFQKNELVIDAVVRNLEIIGEASKSIPIAVRRKYPDIPWNQMGGMRNILIHEYFGVDIKIVWRTVKKSLPILYKQLRQIPSEKNRAS
ncbi:MAG TPA: DUF86 domain-containing protein [Rhabdochlamydiaceae bacterium]|jgi:uncharacterized protein with HEPN domain|nr:DUF86 domain-containing protein [Rhabdochlamydiaceae bacterium]